MGFDFDFVFDVFMLGHDRRMDTRVESGGKDMEVIMTTLTTLNELCGPEK